MVDTIILNFIDFFKVDVDTTFFCPFFTSKFIMIKCNKFNYITNLVCQKFHQHRFLHLNMVIW
jgi:hypothetical protein